jgi:uncharacterized protein DUF885
LPKAFASVRDEKLQADFRKSTDQAAGAISDYLKYLQQVRSGQSFAIGRQNYEAKLRYDEGIELPVETLLRIAERELSTAQREFRKIAAVVDAKRDPLLVWAAVQADHPKPGTLVEEARKQLHALITFLEQRRLVTLPPDQAPLVSPTPDFMRWSSASMWTPGPFETHSFRARYLITDVDPAWSEKQKEEYLGSINHAQLWTTTIHEVYPGHFVQGAYLRQVQSTVRKTWALAPASFVEGWAHYTEQLMIEQGFGDGDPSIKLGQLADSLLRLCRFVVGIREHCEGMSVDEATAFFVRNAYMAETPARLEAERGTFDPTYLSYSFGKLAILKLRDDYRRYKGEEFSLREFHDHLLSVGMAPIWVHRQMMMPGEKGRLVE